MSESKPPEPRRIAVRHAESQPGAPASPAKPVEPKSSGLLTTLPGLLTAVGGIIAAIATLLTALSAAGVIGRSAPPPPPTATPAYSPTPTAARATETKLVYTPMVGAQPAKVLLEDNFSDAKSGWDSKATKEYEIGYKDGQYRIAVHEPDWEAWAIAGQKEDFTDFVIEVDARRVAGPLDNDYGVVVRYQAKPEGCYMFLVSSDGWYAVQIWQNEELRDLVAWTEAKAIRKGDEANHLAVECVGSRLRFSANGTQLVSILDENFRAGRVGLVAGTFDEGGVVVHFDNLKVQAVTVP